MLWYIVTYILGILAAMGSSLKEVEDILQIVSPIALTALVASLIVPFAAFSRTEGVQKWLVQYAIVPLFGMYTVLVWEKGSLVGICILVAAATVHLGYWTSSCHSRMYRLDQYKFGGYNVTLPNTTRVIAHLNGSGNSHISDEIVKAVLGNQRLDAVVLDQVENAGVGPVLRGELQREYARFRCE